MEQQAVEIDQKKLKSTKYFAVKRLSKQEKEKVGELLKRSLEVVFREYHSSLTLLQKRRISLERLFSDKGTRGILYTDVGLFYFKCYVPIPTASQFPNRNPHCIVDYILINYDPFLDKHHKWTPEENKLVLESVAAGLTLSFRVTCRTAKTGKWTQLGKQLHVYYRHVRDHARNLLLDCHNRGRAFCASFFVLTRFSLGHWTSSEYDRLLTIIRAIYGDNPIPAHGLPWGAIGSAMKTRSPNQCRIQWSDCCCCCNSVSAIVSGQGDNVCKFPGWVELGLRLHHCEDV